LSLLVIFVIFGSPALLVLGWRPSSLIDRPVAAKVERSGPAAVQHGPKQ
jgi:hypothetical protein